MPKSCSINVSERKTMPTNTGRAGALFTLSLFLLSCQAASGFTSPATAVHLRTEFNAKCYRLLPVGSRNDYLQQQPNLVAIGLDASSSSAETTIPEPSRRRRVPLVVVGLVVAAAAILKRKVLLEMVASFENPIARYQAPLITILDQLNNAGTSGLVVYAVFLALLTMTLGITTPVETAAGMAFGVRNGIIANGLGKNGGAIVTFLLGRYVLYDVVQRKLKDNEMLNLVEESISERPLGVSLLFRLSPLPECVKNFGLAILKVPVRYAIGAIVLHGLPFTCLWTCLGAETAAVLRDGGAPSALLQGLVTGVSWLGFVGSPALIGLWIKGMRTKAKQRAAGSAPSYPKPEQ